MISRYRYGWYAWMWLFMMNVLYGAARDETANFFDDDGRIADGSICMIDVGDTRSSSSSCELSAGHSRLFFYNGSSYNIQVNVTAFTNASAPVWLVIPSAKTVPLGKVAWKEGDPLWLYYKFYGHTYGSDTLYSQVWAMTGAVASACTLVLQQESAGWFSGNRYSCELRKELINKAICLQDIFSRADSSSPAVERILEIFERKKTLLKKAEDPHKARYCLYLPELSTVENVEASVDASYKIVHDALKCWISDNASREQRSGYPYHHYLVSCAEAILKTASQTLLNHHKS